jgi:hypothetical protein
MEYPPLGASFLRVSRVAVQIERNQVVFLIVRRCLVHVAGRAELLLLEIVRVAGRWSDCLGRPIRVADGVVDVRELGPTRGPAWPWGTTT